MNSHTHTQIPSTTRNPRSSKRRRGQGMVEYIIIVGLIALGTIAAVTSLRTAIHNSYTTASKKVEGVTDQMNKNSGEATPPVDDNAGQ